MDSGEGNSEGALTVQLLKSASNEFDVESIHTLSLSELGLSDINIIGRCVGLERLDLSYNDVNQLHSLSSLASLVTLDLSANRITSLNGLQALDKLERLNLAGNLLGSTDVLKPLASLACLAHLRLHDTLKDISNPICMRQSYRDDVLSLLPKLESLDGEILKGPNAQVFALMSEIENALNSKSSPRRDGPIRTVSPPPDLPPDLFIIERASDQPPSSAERKFRNEMETSKSLSSKSAQLIAQAEEKLRAREKV